MPKDVETGAGGYDQFASPKPGGEIQENGDRPYRGASIPLLLAITIPRMAINMTWSAQWAALGPYLSTMLPNYAVQLTQIIGPSSGIIVAPTVGVFSDRSTNPWGRRRPFLAIASVMSAICWMLMGYTREIGDELGDYGSGAAGEPTDRKWTTFLTVFFYAWMDITVNVVQTPMYLLIADFSGDRQTLGSAIGTGWSTIGSLMVSGYIYLFGAAHKTLKWFLAMLSITMLVTVTISCIFAKEKPLRKDEIEQVSSWQQVKNAFGSIYTGIRTLPGVLLVYGVVYFFVSYGYTAYNGNKGQFFGLVVKDGVAEGSDTCGSGGNPACTDAQNDFNDGVSLAGGSTDTMYNLAGYVFSWTIPFLVTRFGAKWVLVISLVPQSLLMVMAFTKIVAVNVVIVILTSVSQTTIGALLVPVIVHVFGDKAELGVYVGALNSANCFGQLLNFAIGSGLVETSMGYKLPVFIGGAMSFIGVIVGAVFMKLKMNTL